MNFPTFVYFFKCFFVISFKIFREGLGFFIFKKGKKGFLSYAVSLA
jgi:hypothetical protein